MNKLQSLFKYVHTSLKKISAVSAVKKNKHVPVKKQAGGLQVSEAEKSEFAAFQSQYEIKESTVFNIPPAGIFKQSEKVKMNVSSELRPLPPGLVKMLDLCKNSI